MWIPESGLVSNNMQEWVGRTDVERDRIVFIGQGLAGIDPREATGYAR
jgi:hypothetical protein